MFAQAGLNTDKCRFLCAAKIQRKEWGPHRRWVWSYLFVWPAGDLAWCGRGGASWGEQVRIGCWIRAPESERALDYLPAQRIDCREDIKVYGRAPLVS